VHHRAKFCADQPSQSIAEIWPLFDFYPYDAMLARYLLSPCVRLSVRLSVTSRHCTKTAKCRITQTTPYDRSGILSFLMPKISAKFGRGHPNVDAK